MEKKDDIQPKKSYDVLPTYQKLFENVSNCSTAARAILITGSLLWTILTFVLVIWTLVYVTNLKNNDYDPTQVNEIATGFYLTMFIIYIVVSVAIIIAVLIIIFKSYTNKETGKKCMTSPTLKLTYLIYGLIMTFGVVYSILIITILIPSARSVNEDTIVKIDEGAAQFFIIGGIILLVLNVLLLVMSTIVTFMKSGKVEVSPSEMTGGNSVKSKGILEKINEKILDYKSTQLNNQYLSEDFDRVKLASISSPINTTNVEKIYPDQLKPASPKSNKEYADKSLEICKDKFRSGTPRYTVAGGNVDRDSCKYWGLNPNQTVKTETITGTNERTFSVIE